MTLRRDREVQPRACFRGPSDTEKRWLKRRGLFFLFFIFLVEEGGRKVRRGNLSFCLPRWEGVIGKEGGRGLDFLLSLLLGRRRKVSAVSPTSEKAKRVFLRGEKRGPSALFWMRRERSRAWKGRANTNNSPLGEREGKVIAWFSYLLTYKIKKKQNDHQKGREGKDARPNILLFLASGGGRKKGMKRETQK